MRIFFHGGVLLLALQVFVNGRNVSPDSNETLQEGVTAATKVSDKSSDSGTDDLQNAVTESRPNFTKMNTSRLQTDIKNDIKSQTEPSTGTSVRGVPEGNNGNGVSEVPVEVTEISTVETNKITNKKTPAPKTFPFPGPVDRYSNSILVQGHLFGIRDNILTMIHMALSSSNTFVPVQPLRIHPLESSYEEMGYEGDKYTQIRYVVSYNGVPIHTEVITRLMSTPKVSHHFKKQMGERQLREYKPAKSVKNEPWIHDHLAAVVVPSCIAFVVILAIVSVVARKRYVKASKLEQKKKSCKSGVVSDKKCKPPPYSVDNPAYNL